jgi:hypothetical protein
MVNSHRISIDDKTYIMLERKAKGFETPADVIKRVVVEYEKLLFSLRQKNHKAKKTKMAKKP